MPGVSAWVVTPTVWLLTYWFGQKIVKIPSKRLNATICSDMSVCGVSAAIATAAACRAKKEELTLAVGLSLVFTSIMMIVMPAVIKSTFPEDMQLVNLHTVKRQLVQLFNGIKKTCPRLPWKSDQKVPANR